MDLSELQRSIQDHLLAGGPPAADLLAAVEPPAVERWAIYAEAYRLRIVEALATQYPALASRLGRPAFDARAAAFVAATPSVHRSIRDYGAEFGAFLAASTGAGLEEELLGELATFEWQLAAAFDARDVRAAEPADLADVAPEEWPTLRFGPVPALGRLATRTNAVAAWRAARSAGAEPPVAAPAAARSEPVEWLISRRGLETEFRSLEADEAAALDRLLGGEPFGELCGWLAEREGDAAALRAAGWLKGWLAGGLLLRL